MNLEGSLGEALYELWQAALTVSTLKYVAGLLSQETQQYQICNSLENEEEKHDPMILDREESNNDQTEAVEVAETKTVPREEAQREEESCVCHSPSNQESPAYLEQKCPQTEILDQEFDISSESAELFEHGESLIYSDLLYNKPAEPLEDDFSISMVSHQILSPALPEEHQDHHMILTSVCHQQHQLEEDFSDPQTSIASHYRNSYYEIVEEARQNNIEEEEEEITEDYTYTDMDHLETIQEVSEVCDLTEQTDTTETEFIEDIEDFPTLNLNDVDILTTISNDEPVESITDPLENCPQSEALDQDIETKTSQAEEVIPDPEMDSIPSLITTEQIVDNEAFPTFDMNDVDILDAISKDINEPVNSLSMKAEVVAEAVAEADAEVEPEAEADREAVGDRFETIPSLQCHFMTSLEYESEKLPSCEAHRVSNTITEETDYPSMVTHSQHVFYLKNYPVLGNEYHEAESASKLKVKSQTVDKAIKGIQVDHINEARSEYQERQESSFINPVVKCHFINQTEPETDIIEDCLEEHFKSSSCQPQFVYLLENHGNHSTVEARQDEALGILDQEEKVSAEEEEHEDHLTVIEAVREHQIECEFLQSFDCESELLPLTVENSEDNTGNTQCDDLHHQDSQYEGTEDVTTEQSTPSNHVSVGTEAPTLQEDDIESQDRFSTSMVSHQTPSIGLYEDYSEVQFMTSMQTHVNMMPCEENDYSSQVSHSHSIIPFSPPDIYYYPEEEESSMLPLEEELSCLEDMNTASDGATQSHEIQSHEIQSHEIQSHEIQSYSEIEGANTNESKSATESSEYEDGIKSYKLQLTRIKELQKLVEDELEEFDTKRKVKHNIVEATETQIINIVKGIEFKSEIKITQFEDGEDDDLDNTEQDVDSIADDNTNIEIETKNEVIEEEILERSNSEEDLYEEENLIHASCTLRKDNTVSISSNIVNIGHGDEDEKDKDLEREPENNDEDSNGQEDDDKDSHAQEDDKNMSEVAVSDNREDVTSQKELKSEELQNDQDKKENDLKLQLRTEPRKSVSLETRIRDKQLLDSLLGDNKMKENVPVNEDERKEKKEKPSILKQNKSSITLASFNENVKKQSYRIKFRVKLNDKSSKESSVLRYLFGCFGGEKLFNSNH